MEWKGSFSWPAFGFLYSLYSEVRYCLRPGRQRQRRRKEAAGEVQEEKASGATILLITSLLPHPDRTGDLVNGDAALHLPRSRVGRRLRLWGSSHRERSRARPRRVCLWWSLRSQLWVAAGVVIEGAGHPCRQFIVSNPSTADGLIVETGVSQGHVLHRCERVGQG